MASLAFVKALSLGLAFQPLGLALRDCDAGSFLQTGKAVPWLEPAAQPIKLFLNANLHVLGDVYLGQLKGCSVACEITQEHLEDADVVVWNARWMSPHPGPPPLSSKPSHQKWVFNFDAEAPLNHDSPVNKGTVDALAQGIDWTFTFKTSSDFFKPYYMMGEGAELVEQAELSKDWARNKTQLLLWFVSNCGSKRKATFEALSEKLPADRVKVYGACGERHPCGQSIFRAKDCIQRVATPFKFYAAFENNRCDGYITEKLWTAYNYGMVPVVWGGCGRADYEKIVPKESFIHVDDFKSTADLANFLQELDKDDARYNTYFEWKKRFHVMSGLQNFEQKYCELCREASKPPSEQKPSRTFGNLTEWWYSTCSH